MKNLPLRIQLNSITCHDTGDSMTTSKPYLWVVFFKVDGSCIELTGEFRIAGTADFQFSEGSHGNLGTQSVSNGDVIRVPEHIGQWSATLEPLTVPYFEKHIPGLTGVIAILMEEDNVSARGAEAGHVALNKYILQIVNNALANFDPKRIDLENIEQSIKIYFDEKVSKYTAGIEQMVGKAVQDSQSLIENVWSLVDKDDLIGYKIWNFNNTLIEKSDGYLSFSHRWTLPDLGDWEIKGSIQVR